MVRDVSKPMGETSRLEPLVTVEEAATFLGVQVGTVYLWAETEQIPSYKIGALRRFRVSELETHMQARRSGPPEHPHEMGAAGTNASQTGGMMPGTRLT